MLEYHTMSERCYLCAEAYERKEIPESEVEVVEQTCFICRKPVCDYHSGLDSKNKNMIICDECQYES